MELYVTDCKHLHFNVGREGTQCKEESLSAAKEHTMSEPLFMCEIKMNRSRLLKKRSMVQIRAERNKIALTLLMPVSTSTLPSKFISSRLKSSNLADLHFYYLPTASSQGFSQLS